MILTRSTRLIQPQGPVEISPDFGGAGVVYLPNVRSDITRVAGTVMRSPTQQGVSAVYTAGEENKIERLTGSAPNGVTELTQIVYITPQAGGNLQDRGVLGSRSTTTSSSYIQTTHRALDRGADGRFCWVFQYKPTAAAIEVFAKTNDNTAVLGSHSLIVTTIKNGRMKIWHNGLLHQDIAVTQLPFAGSLDLQIGNYYDNVTARRLSANVHFAAFLPSGMGDAEVAALSRNPWQLFRPVQRRVYFDMGAGGGGTTTVSSDQSATYLIRGAVSSDQAASYAIRSSVSADLSAGYEIRTSAQSDALAEYAIRASVQADSSADYVVRGAVLSDASASYVVRTSASADIIAAYEIQTASGVSASLDASYNVRAAVQADAYAAYDLRTAVGAISEHAFMVRGLVSSDLDASYTVEAAITQVYADLQAAYLVDGGAVVIPSQFVASVPAGVFSARAPSGEYSATVPAGIFKASI